MVGKEITAYRLTKRAPGKGRPEHDRWMKDPSAGRARCPQRAARNNQRATLDRPVQTNHLATARWIHIHENRSLSRRLCRSEAGRACPQRAVCTSADLHSRRVEDNTPYLDEVNASTGKTVEREYEQHRAKGGSGVSFALGPRHGPALAAGADQPFDG